MLQPGQPERKYHSEGVQEDFLVLGGECLVLLEGEERAFGAWDFVHCEPGAAHVFVGAGEGPAGSCRSAPGARRSTLDYPAGELAARHNAAAAGADGRRRRGVLGLAVGREARHGAVAPGLSSAALSVAASHRA